jgi:hypothetical protein
MGSMRSALVSRIVGVVAGMAVMAGASCSKDDNPEDFCQSWVASTCQALTGCCQTGTDFDVDQCRLDLSASCQTSTDATQVEAGEVKFDSGAASVCLGTVTSCPDLAASTSDTSYAQEQACANMLTGFRPLGAACTGTGQCAPAGDFTTCYDGNGGTTPTSSGVCAQVVLDPTTCSFSFSTLELHVCPDGMFCDRVAVTPTANEPPSQQAFEFSASCKAPVTAGGACSTSGLGLPCVSGLVCEATSPTVATCVALPAAGAPCPTGICGVGLECAPGPTGVQTCQNLSEPSLGSFCFATGKCGDGVCQPPETPLSCPQDCGANCAATCADAITNGGTPCTTDATTAEADYEAFASCAEESCASECASLAQTGMDAACASCMETNCEPEVAACADN